MICTHNHRRLLLAVVFIAINLIILPSRITKSGFEAGSSSRSDGGDSHPSPVASSILGEALSIRAGGDLPWTDSYEPRQTKARNVRVSFRLHDVEDEPRPDKFLSVDSFFCQNRTDLPRTLQSNGNGRLFDFTTTVSTDLRLVFMGDSLGHQFCQGFEAAVLGKGHELKRTVQKKYNIGRKVFDCLVSSAPVRGGGAVAFWRYTKLLQRKTWAKITPCYSNERLWGENFLMELLDHKYSDEPAGLSEITVNQFDAAIVRIPHGWMTAEEITKERLEEVITFAQNLLGVRVVIFTTVGLDNNAIGAEQWSRVEKINEYVHEIASNFKPTSVDGVQWIMVQEWSRFTSAILRENGLSMGYNTSSNDFFFERLVGGETSWAQSVPMVCANRPKDNLHSECKRNKISPDGIHWCVETLGPRFTASIACLLGCAYNERPPDRTQRGVSRLKRCERDCNEQFMSLNRIGDKYIGDGLTIHSTSSTI